MDPLFFEIVEKLDRQAPGDGIYSLKALSYVDLPDKKLQVLDLGCGTGVQSYLLQKQLEAHIFSVDLHKPFLDNFQKVIKFKNIQDNFTLVHSDINKLEFPDQSFDLIWSEGALYNIGINKALKICQKLLVENGALVFSELNWIQKPTDKKLISYWKTNYPKMLTIDKTIDLIEKQGFQFEDYITLPISSHLNNYYKPLQKLIDEYKEKKLSKSQQKVVDDFQQEIDLYNEFQGQYGYVFYIARK